MSEASALQFSICTRDEGKCLGSGESPMDFDEVAEMLCEKGEVRESVCLSDCHKIAGAVTLDGEVAFTPIANLRVSGKGYEAEPGQVGTLSSGEVAVHLPGPRKVVKLRAPARVS